MSECVFCHKQVEYREVCCPTCSEKKHPCEAWDTIGKFADAVGNTHIIATSRAIYETADPTRKKDKVLFQRLEQVDYMRLRSVRRYVQPDLQVTLTPIKR